MSFETEIDLKESYDQLQSSGVSIVEKPKKSSYTTFLFLYLNVFISICSTFNIGYSSGTLAPTYNGIKNDYNISESQQSLLITIILVGGLIGTIICSFIVDGIGRKYTILLNNIIIGIGVTLSCIGHSYPIFITARFITGIGNGIASTSVTIYVTEISPSDKRGSLGIIRQIAGSSGFITATIISYGMVHVKHGWRYSFLLSISSVVIQLILCFWFVESPRWLFSQNREKEAVPILEKLNADKSESEIENLVSNIKLDLEQQKNDISWSKLFNKKYWKIYLIGIGFCSFQHGCGINVIVYYSTTIISKLMNGGYEESALWTVVVTLPQLAFLVTSLWLIDRFGRRPLFITGLSAMIVSFSFLGYTFYDRSHSKSLNILSLIMMIIFKIGFSISLGPIPFIIAAEIFPQKIRGKAMSIATFGSYLTNILANIVYIPLLNLLGLAGIFWFYASINAVALIIVIFMVPETKSIPIEELHKMLIKEKSPKEMIDINNNINPPK